MVAEREPLVPARMINEWVYCPRLAYLEWVDGEWGIQLRRRMDGGFTGGSIETPMLPCPDRMRSRLGARMPRAGCC